MIETFIFVNSRDVLCFTSSDEILSWQRLSPVFFTFERGVQAHKKAEISSRPGLPDLVGLGQLCYIYIPKSKKFYSFFLTISFTPSIRSITTTESFSIVSRFESVRSSGVFQIVDRLCYNRFLPDQTVHIRPCPVRIQVLDSQWSGKK